MAYDMSARQAGERILSFVSQIERLMEEKAEIAEEMKAVKATAAAEGFDKDIISLVIKRRAMGRDRVEEQDQLLETYEHGLMTAEATVGSDLEAARDRGDAAFHSGEPRTANPFLKDDPRHAAWDRAWVQAAAEAAEDAEVLPALPAPPAALPAPEDDGLGDASDPDGPEPDPSD